MTPSEIADALEARHKYDKVNYPSASPLDRQAADAIRDLEDERDALVVGYTNIQHSRSEDRAKLKIATEALDRMIALYEGEHDPENMKRPQWLVEALARIKEA